MPDNATILLKRARALLSDPDHWIKGRLAEDAHGNRILSSSPSACRFCIYGALHHASLGFAHDDQRRAHRRLKLHLPALFLSIPSFNDDGTTTHADVLALFDRAIGS